MPSSQQLSVPITLGVGGSISLKPYSQGRHWRDALVHAWLTSSCGWGCLSFRTGPLLGFLSCLWVSSVYTVIGLWSIWFILPFSTRCVARVSLVLSAFLLSPFFSPLSLSAWSTHSVEQHEHMGHPFAYSFLLAAAYKMDIGLASSLSWALLVNWIKPRTCFLPQLSPSYQLNQTQYYPY